LWSWYFFNEADGLANNHGITTIATTTNHLEKLDGGLANNPSGFDREYNFPVPGYEKRVLYSEFWRRKPRRKEAVDFSKGLDPEIARIIKDF
jgi:AAA+ superfamily predicted ATPase